MRNLTGPLPQYFSEKQLDANLHQEIVRHDQVDANDIYNDVRSHLTPYNLDVDYALQKLEQLPQEHAIWRLASLNDIYISGQDVFSDMEKEEIKEEITDAAYTLVAKRLPAEELSATDMPSAYFDETNSYPSVTLKAMYLVADAWDITGRTPQMQDYVEKMIDNLDDQNQDNSQLRTEERATFYKALYTGISYREAHLQQMEKGNEIDLYTKAGQKLVQLYMDQ